MGLNSHDSNSVIRTQEGSSERTSRAEGVGVPVPYILATEASVEQYRSFSLLILFGIHHVLCVRVCVTHLLVLGRYRVQDVPSQAQYGSLARQHSAQAFPYMLQRWRGTWAMPVSEPTYSCCCEDKERWERLETRHPRQTKQDVNIKFGDYKN